MNEFIRARLDVASRLSRAKRDFIGAYEFKIRSLLWDPNGDALGFRQQTEQELIAVALQAVSERFHHNSTMATLVLCDCRSSEQLLSIVRMFVDESVAEARSVEDVVGAADREALLIVVDNEEPFRTARETGEYYRFFTDAFGGEFGHLTKPGRRIVAHRLAETVYETLGDDELRTGSR